MPKICTIHYRKLARVFERKGFVLDRQEGDHLIYVRKDIKRPIIIPMYKSIPVFIILNNVNSARPIPVQEHRAFGERSFL